MKIFKGILLLLISFPLIVLGYNFYVKQGMERDIPKRVRNDKTGIIQGAEPIFLDKGSKKAALLIHGYIGSPTDFGQLPKLLHDAGYTVSVPLLPGHGRDPRDFSKVTTQQLIDFVDLEYAKVREQYQEVTLIGFSMGGALSVITSVKYSQNPPDQMILLAPYFQIKHEWYYILPAAAHQKAFSPFIPYLKKPEAFKQLYKKENRPFVIDYEYISTKGTRAAVEIGDMARSQAEQIKVPTLMIHSRKDKATDYKATERIVNRLNREDVELVTLETSNHIILWDYEQAQVEAAILKFLA